MKTLLLCGLMAVAATASAATPKFSDYLQIKVADRVYAEGETIQGPAIADEFGTLTLDIHVVNISGQTLSLTGALLPTGTPSIEDTNSDPDKWDAPAFCYTDLTSGAGNCFGGDNKTNFGKGTATLSPDSNFMWQIHLYDGKTTYQTYTLQNIVSVTLPAEDEDSEPEVISLTQKNLLTFGGDSAVESITDSTQPAKWYDLSGREIESPSQEGIYIMRRGSHTSKHIVR